MKNTVITTFTLSLALILSGCLSANELRMQKMVGDYSMVELVQLGENPKNKLNYEDFGASNTQEAVDEQSKTLKENAKLNVKAVTQSYKTKSGKLQCVIVYKKGTSVTTLNHEAGHCFSGLIKEASKFNAEIDSSEYGDYLFELFAELAAAIRAYNIDGNTEYIDQRIADINAKKDEGTKPYRKALIALEHYKSSVLGYKVYEGLSAKEQVISMFSDNDLQLRISRENYDNFK